ncbi:MAG: molybdopterin molybdotransferase MoeA [Lachnospiraceae bacterium]|nr:molybdopterin molybdotransferase MoeA [Lachnospiraceae bacterium]
MMKLLHTDTLQEAREKLERHTQSFPVQVKWVKSREARNRVCACDVYAGENVPSFRRSTVDGFAVLAEDSFGAGESNPVFLEVAERIPIEKKARIPLESGQAAQVQTGSMIPEGAAAVVMAEYCEAYAADKILVNKSVSAGENIAQIGEDIRKGERLIRRGQKITSREIGMLASLGIKKVLVAEPFTVTIISTGDELTDPEEGGMEEDGTTKEQTEENGSMPESRIRDINSWSLAALAEENGFLVRECIRTGDVESDICQAVLRGSEQSDIVVLSGGSSKGEKDYSLSALEQAAGTILTHGISIKPGKPTILACDQKRQTILAGLPGHPLAAWLMFRLLLCDWQEKKLGLPKKRLLPAVMQENVSSNQGRETCLLVRLQEVREEEEEMGAGVLYGACPVYTKSGSISSLSRADGFLLIPRNREGLKKGERVYVELW